MRIGGENHAPTCFTPGKRTSNQGARGCVGPRAGLDECEKLAPNGISSTNLSALSHLYIDKLKRDKHMHIPKLNAWVIMHKYNITP
jgi:hypothetical protein